MNATRRLTHLTMIAATLAATFLAQAGDGADAAHGPASFETAVIAGQRFEAPAPAPTVRLPTVTIIGRRTAPGGTVHVPAVVHPTTASVVGQRAPDEAPLLAQTGKTAV